MERDSLVTGEMLEWLKRHAWKACKLPKGFPSSNLGLSAGSPGHEYVRDFFALLADCLSLRKNETPGNAVVTVVAVVTVAAVVTKDSSMPSPRSTGELHLSATV